MFAFKCLVSACVCKCVFAAAAAAAAVLRCFIATYFSTVCAKKRHTLRFSILFTKYSKLKKWEDSSATCTICVIDIGCLSWIWTWVHGQAAYVLCAFQLKMNWKKKNKSIQKQKSKPFDEHSAQLLIIFGCIYISKMAREHVI